MTEGNGLSSSPAPLLEGGETIALKDGKSVYVPRWAARKSLQVAKFLSGISFDAGRIEALRTASPMAFVNVFLDVAEEKAIAFVDMCLTAEDRARIRVGDIDYIDFVSLAEAIVRVNLTEGDRKKLWGLVASLRASAAGPSSTPSSPPSAA